jgi:hypothetical protein
LHGSSAAYFGLVVIDGTSGKATQRGADQGAEAA